MLSVVSSFTLIVYSQDGPDSLVVLNNSCMPTSSSAPTDALLGNPFLVVRLVFIGEYMLSVIMIVC